MASRFQRDASRNALFSDYDAQTRSRPSSTNHTAGPNATRSKASPYGPAGGSSSPYDTLSTAPPPGAGFASAYTGASNADPGFRTATPNKKGHYSDAVMDELESQNDAQVSEMTKKVRMLKDITIAIGDEIRDSTAFAEKMNDGFDATRNRLRGTMNRMLRMAERTGIGWRVWLAFFAFVFLLFVYVWLA